MRLIDADALMEILATAIRNMQGMAKFLGVEDDPEIKMEIKAYIDIANGVKEQPTIEPERKKGKWNGDTCSECGNERAWHGCQPRFCPDCGSYNRREEK